MTFRTIGDLEGWLRAAGLAEHLPGIRATARPTALFARESVADDPLPVGTHKFGGYPDLPEGAPWPERPALPDPEAKAAGLLKGAERVLAGRAGASPDGSVGREAHAEMWDDLLTRHAVQRSALFRPFPLAFVAQFDLADLAERGALDPALPRYGLLSLFHDVTWKGQTGRHWAFWYAQPLAAFKRAELPDRLVAFHETAGRSYERDPVWGSKRSCERLHPFAALTIPELWWEDPILEDRDWSAVFPAMKPFVYDPAPAFVAAGEWRADFADRLGGWPEPLQRQHPEWAVPGTAAERRAPPGHSPWRQLYSGDNQFMGGTRFMDTDRAHGDRLHVMIRADALRARRFDETATVYAYE